MDKTFNFFKTKVKKEY